MNNFEDKDLTLKEQKEALKNAITTIVENYKMLLISNNKITNDEKQKFYNDLEHNVTIIEFIANCNLDEGVLWRGIENKVNNGD